MTSEKPDQLVVLLITENPSIISWMRKHLDDRFFLIKAEKEAQAVQTTESTELDFILLDSDFEASNPLVLCSKLRQMNRVVPILLITGRLKTTYRDMALDAGATDFLNDRLDLEELETRFATGKKAALEREKVTGFSNLIKTAPKLAASHDYLSNKRLLNEEAERLLSEARKENENVALLTIRADHFQEIEAEVGMVAADRLQQALGERLESLLEPDDLLIPYSNGRFILLMKEINSASARAIAETLQSTVEEEPFTLNRKPTHMSISIAISESKTGNEQYDQMIARATKVLKQADSMANQILSVDKETH